MSPRKDRTVFKNPQPLNRTKHAGLFYDPNQSYSFAANEIRVPVLAAEMTMVARDYVVVFDAKAPVAYALLGVERDKNAYVTERGQWRGRYRPAVIRSYPFTMVATEGDKSAPDNQQRFTIVIDADAMHLSSLDGDRLFDGMGQPTETMKRVQSVLESIQKDHFRTRKLIGLLETHGLLVTQHLTVKQSNTAITGLRVVDAEALSKLAPAALAELRTSGALELAYAQLLSLTNLRDSPLSWVGETDHKDPDRKSMSLFAEGGDIDLDFLN
jgi:hypothetical protein